MAESLIPVFGPRSDGDAESLSWSDELVARLRTEWTPSGHVQPDHSVSVKFFSETSEARLHFYVRVMTLNCVAILACLFCCLPYL